jgi:hypothetical protein
LAKSLFKDEGLDPVIIRNINILKDTEINCKTGLVFDDISFEELTREQKVHLFDVENDSHIWVLYAATNLPAKTPRIFTTNYLESVLGKKSTKKPDYPEEFIRRLILVNISNSLIKFSVKKTIIEKTTTVEKDKITENQKTTIEELAASFEK